MLAAICTLAAVSCSDDFPYYSGEIPEGEGNLSATITFTPNQASNLGGTRTPGDAIQTINSLCVLVYTTDGELVRKYLQSELLNYNCNQKGYTVDKDKDHLDGTAAEAEETETPQATFTLPGLPYGRYRIYAVANMGDLSKYTDEIQTADGLKSIRVNWDPENISANNQMFGCFTNGKSSKFDDAVVEFVSDNSEIHAWVRRLASKVTVAYDASGLKQNVWIYIKNVTIHDIPKSCSLGDPNTIKDSDDLLNRKTDNSPDAEPELEPNTRIVYDAATGYSGTDHIYYKDIDGIELYNGLVDSLKNSGNVVPIIKGSDHAYNANSLFFYENMQGDYEGNSRYDKTQHPTYNDDGNKNEDGVGENIRKPENDNDYKDRVPYGTYIEVEAYYVSTNSENPSEGNIKYRFMLGKNVTYNYDAQRNYHFKLTLGFRGWANQPDWHIDYEEPVPSLEVSPVFRVSYMYHEKSMMPIKISGKCTKLTVEIKENNWAPYDPSQQSQVPPMDGGAMGGSYEYRFRWNRDAWANGLDGVKRPWLGFLALQVTDNYYNETTIPIEYYEDPENQSNPVYYEYRSGEAAQIALKEYYEGKAPGSVNQYYREFNSSQLDVPDGQNSQIYNPSSPNSWTVTNTNDDKNAKVVMLPLWTRTKTMIQLTGFSGNNPYEYFERKALLHIEATFEGYSEPFKEDVVVLQVPRLVNPKGVWRNSTNNDSFHVQLMQAITSNGESDFNVFNSAGDWEAYIDVDKNNIIKLSPTSPDAARGELDKLTGHIIGRTGTPIDFNIDFTGNKGCAVVTVLYHGKNCVHKIYVRKGYEDPITMGGNQWSSFCVYGTRWKGYESGVSPSGDGYNDEYYAIFTINPLAIGSNFRRGKQSEAILVKNNNETQYLGPMMAPQDKPMKIYQRSSTSASTITWTANGYRNDTPFSYNGMTGNSQRTLGNYYATVGGVERVYRVPTLDDFNKLAEECQYGFGVMYGDGAVGVQKNHLKAYGMLDEDNNIGSSENGMRGVVVYNSNGDQIFFPVGKYGMGRRRQFNFSNTAVGNAGLIPSTGSSWYGSLWYSDVEGVLSGSNSSVNNYYRPVVYNLPIAAGAVYWIDKFEYNAKRSGSDWENSMGWDVNYFNYDFGPYSANNYADACPMKLIIKRIN